MNRLPRLIGISGQLNSGKDEVAKMIVSLTSRLQHTVIIQGEFVKIGDSPYMTKRFAGKLKEMTAVALNVPLSQLEDRDYKESVIPRYGITVRKIMQDLGQYMRDTIHPDFWVNLLFDQYNGDSWLLPDMRHVNELERVKSYGGLTIRVDRPELAEDLSHKSETEWRDLPFDIVIRNSHDLNHLRKEVKKVLDLYR